VKILKINYRVDELTAILYYQAQLQGIMQTRKAGPVPSLCEDLQELFHVSQHNQNICSSLW